MATELCVQFRCSLIAAYASNAAGLGVTCALLGVILGVYALM